MQRVIMIGESFIWAAFGDTIEDAIESLKKEWCDLLCVSPSEFSAEEDWGAYRFCTNEIKNGSVFVFDR